MELHGNDVVQITGGQRISGAKSRHGNRMFAFTFSASTGWRRREIVPNEHDILP